MSKKDFDNFIEQQNNQSINEPPVDWDKIREEWLTNLNKFYDLIKFFLVEYEKLGNLSYQFSNKDIFEEYIGNYPVKVLELLILGKHKVRLEPIGTNIISADGRVDLIGANGKIKFVLVPKNYSAPSPIKVIIKVEGEQETENKEIKTPEKVELAWKIATPPPRIKYIDLEQDTFFDALLEVVGG